MKFASLFSGIGGFELGFHAAAHATELMCDVDPAAVAVLRARFEGIPLVGDVRALGDLPSDVDILTAGFPCQDLSSVGNKGGIWGERSGLVSEVFRLVAASRPKWVLIENVYFMLHLDRGRGMRVITEQLEALGYSWAYRVLDSNGFGLAQRRRRVFILASHTEDPRTVLLAGAGQRQAAPLDAALPIGFYWTEGTYAAGLTADGIPPLKGGSTIGIPSPPAVLMPNGVVGTPQITDAEALQGFPVGWTEPAGAIKESLRWRLVGNAVSVPVAAWLGAQLNAPITYDSRKDAPLSTRSRWPEAAWSVKGERGVAEVGQHPMAGATSSLLEMLQSDLKPLSARASAGFLGRARKGNLKYPNGFLERIEEHLQRVN